MCKRPLTGAERKLPMEIALPKEMIHGSRTPVIPPFHPFSNDVLRHHGSFHTIRLILLLCHWWQEYLITDYYRVSNI